ncbi:hypothetical protein SHIRM173S_07199 [Streptomyces hirsutus]
MSTSGSFTVRVSQNLTDFWTLFSLAAGLLVNRECTGPRACPVTSMRSVSCSTVTVISMVRTRPWPSHRVHCTPR